MERLFLPLEIKEMGLDETQVILKMPIAAFCSRLHEKRNREGSSDERRDIRTLPRPPGPLCLNRIQESWTQAPYTDAEEER